MVWSRNLVQPEGESPDSAAALFLVKYSSARTRFLATDGFTHFFHLGNVINKQPVASSFSFAPFEKALALNFNFTLTSPSPKIFIGSLLSLPEGLIKPFSFSDSRDTSSPSSNPAAAMSFKLPGTNFGKPACIPPPIPLNLGTLR